MNFVQRNIVQTTVAGLLLCITAGYGFYIASGAVGWISRLATIELPATRAMGLTDMMHDGLRGAVISGLYAIEQNDQPGIEAASLEIDEMSKNMKDHLDVIKALPLAPELMVKIATAEVSVNEYISAAKEIALKFNERPKTNSIKTALGNFMTQFDALEESLGALGDEIEKSAMSSAQASTLESQQGFRNLMILSLTAFFLLAAFSWSSIRALRKECSSLVHAMFGTFRELETMSHEIRRQSAALSESSSSAASASEESAASAHEISAIAKQNSANAETGNKLASSGSALSQSVMAQVQDLEGAMNELATSNEDLKQIVQVIESIEEKTSSIHGVVFETRLLAFNASIEAERAGEAGKGFAVVAASVGKLANQSGELATGISSLIRESTRQVTTIISQIGEKVSNGRGKTDLCKQSMTELKATLGSLADAVSGIYQTSSEQRTGVQEISNALLEIDRVTQSNLKSSQTLTEQSNLITQSTATMQDKFSKLTQYLGVNSAMAQEPAEINSLSKSEKAIMGPQKKAA